MEAQMKVRPFTPFAIAVAFAASVGVAGGAKAQSADTTKKDTTVKKDTMSKVDTVKIDTVRVDTVTVNDTTRHIVYTKRVTTAPKAKVTKVVSSKRIPVRKEVTASGRVELLRADTVIVFVAPPPPPPAPVIKRVGPFYWGLGAGASLPTEQLRTGYETGYNGTFLLGWDPYGSPFGVRLDVGYDRMQGRSVVAKNDIGMVSANLNAKLRAPLRMLGDRAHLYAVGGGGAVRVWGGGHGTVFQIPNEDGTISTTTAYPVSESFSDGETEFGWNAGGGFSWGVGRASLFIESRYFSVNANNVIGNRTRWVPILIGVTFP
jgi:pentapeptide MXKDX repeat protein